MIFFHPTCSGSGCSVSIAFETTYFLLHSLLNPTIESGPPSSSGDCWAKLSTAVPHPRLHSSCLLGRHSERPKYVRTVVCRFWRNFATKLLSRGSTLHAETKSRTPEKIKSQKKSILFFMTPIYYNNQFIFFDFGDQKTKLSFFAILFSQLAFLGSQIWDRNGIDLGRCSSPRSAQSYNRNSLSVSLVDLGGKRSHEDPPPPRRSWREKEQEHRPLRHQMQVRFRGVAR